MSTKIGAWIAVAVVVAVPLLIQLDKARSLLLDGPMRHRLWTVLGTMAALGLIALLGHPTVPVRTGPAVLVVIPAAQALVFVVAYKVFCLVAGRMPVPFRQSQIYASGMRYVADVLFWVTLSMGLIIGAALACAYLDVELPTRGVR